MVMMAGPPAVKGAAAGIRKLRGMRKKKPGVKAPVRKRQRRIVFSENQWEFVRSLIRATTGRSLPAAPGGRRRRRKRPFGG